MAGGDAQHEGHPDEEHGVVRLGLHLAEPKRIAIEVRARREEEEEEEEEDEELLPLLVGNWYPSLRYVEDSILFFYVIVFFLF